jgi:hypothetical protein
MINRNLLQHPQFVVRYLEDLLNPRLWIGKADEMLEASNVLEPQLRQFWSVAITNAKEEKYNKGSEHLNAPPPNLHGPYFILVSYALENLFKAIIVVERSEEIRSQFFEKGKLPRLINEHDLLRLSKEANIKVDIKEEDILVRLFRQSKWKGRYPVPVELHDLRNVLQYSNGKPYFADYYAPQDLDRLHIIVQKVRSRVVGYVNKLR